MKKKQDFCLPTGQQWFAFARGLERTGKVRKTFNWTINYE